MGTKERVGGLLVAAATGRPEVFAAACADEVRWWAPCGAGWITGRDEVTALVSDLLAGGAGPSGPAALLADESGTTVVVEWGGPPNAAGGPVTSVIELADGLIVAGRSYLDVRDVGPDAEETT